MSRYTKAIIFDWVGVLFSYESGVYPFAEKVLKTLRPKYKLGLVTLASQGIGKRIADVKLSGLGKYFDSIVIEDSKEKEQYLDCIEQLGVQSNKVLVVDDQIARLRIAKEIGCSTVWITEKSGEVSNIQSVDKITNSIENLISET